MYSLSASAPALRQVEKKLAASPEQRGQAPWHGQHDVTMRNGLEHLFAQPFHSAVGYLTEALHNSAVTPGWRRAGSRASRTLEHALGAKLLALERARDLVAGIEQLRAEVLAETLRRGPRPRLRPSAEGHRSEAVPNLAFALASPASIAGG